MNIVSSPGVQFRGGLPSVEGGATHTKLSLRVSNARHMQPGSAGQAAEEAGKGGFAGALQEALSGVEKLDTKSKNLTAQAVFDPDSVNVHEVVVAAEKAKFALTLTKSVADGLIRTYKELIAPR